MIVYNFTSEKYALSNINNKRIKISTIDDLNDPFELLAISLSDKHFRKSILNSRNKIIDTKGIICFSLNWKNPLLWGHYADKHNGICLGFDIPDRMLQKIEYVEARQLVSFKSKDKSDLGKFEKLLNLKFIDWEYEEEYRIWVDLNTKKCEDGKYFYNFNPLLTLKEIIIGPRNTMSPTDLSKLITTDASGFTIKKARIAFRTYSVVQNMHYKTLLR